MERPRIETRFATGCGFEPFLGQRVGDDADDQTCDMINDTGKCWRVYASETKTSNYRLIKEVEELNCLAADGFFELRAAQMPMKAAGLWIGI